MGPKNIVDNLPNPSKEEMQLIILTTKKVAKLDGNAPNENQIRTIIKQEKKTELEGSRLLDFGTAIGIVGSIITITQCVIEAIKWFKGEYTSSQKTNFQIDLLIKEKLIVEFQKHEKLRLLLEENPKLIYDVIRSVRHND